MTLTIQQIWERYSEVEPVRDIEIRRVDTNGNYEASWVDIETLVNTRLKPHNVVNEISFKLPNDTYSLGAVTVNNASFLFENIRGEFSDETNPYSIFNGFIRHKSLIRVRDGFIDKYTDPDNPEEVKTTSFQGFIDDKLCETMFNDQEKVIATDVMVTLMRQYTIGNFSPISATTINALVLEIMDRSEFTDFFTVDVGNISAGYNASSLDLSKYDTSLTIFDLFQDISKGQSIFYVREGVFYYKKDDPTSSVIINFGLAPERKIQFSKYKTGALKVKDKLYWEGSNAEYLAAVRIYDQPYTFNIASITNNVQRQGYVDFVGPRINPRKTTFDLTIPFLPILFILDKITVIREGHILPNSFILDISQLDVNRLIDPLGSIIIPESYQWKIKGIKHTKKTSTVLSIEKIV